MVRSTSQRCLPSPEPCGVWRRAITGLTPALPEWAALLVVVVAALGEKRLGSSSGPAGPAADGRHPVGQLEQLPDDVTVATGERPGRRDATAVYEDVVFAACPAAIERAGTRLGAPLFRLDVAPADRPFPLKPIGGMKLRPQTAHAAAPTPPPPARLAAATRPSSHSQRQAPTADAPSRSPRAARTIAQPRSEC